MGSYFHLIFCLFAISQCSRLYAQTLGKEEAAATVVQMMDRNGDDKIDPTEIYYFVAIISRINLSNDTLAAEFKTLDLNQDGFLAASEIDSSNSESTAKKARPPNASGEEVVKLADTNGDGVVSLAEAYEYFSKNVRITLTKPALEVEIKSLDKNNDGVLSSSELDPRNSSII